MRAKRLLIVILTMLVGAALLPTSSLAATQGSCPASDTEKVLLFENSIGDTGNGDDRLWKCSSDTNLLNDVHEPAGGCEVGVFDEAYWAVCVSSYQIYLPSNRRICFYREANYQSYTGVTKAGPISGVRYNTIGFSDELWSFRFLPTSEGC